MFLNCGVGEDSRVPWAARSSNRSILKELNSDWIFIGRADAKAEAPILWLPDAKNWLIRKDLDAGKDWRQEEKRTTEGEMVGWHHWLNGHEFEYSPGVGYGQGGLVCCSPWGRLNWTELKVLLSLNNYLIVCPEVTCHLLQNMGWCPISFFLFYLKSDSITRISVASKSIELA